MTFSNRLRFIFGITLTFAIVGILVLILNNAMNVVHSSKAVLNADTTTVGTDYPGLIVKQEVEEGSHVTKGQVIFEIKSAQLSDDLRGKTVQLDSAPFEVNPATGNLVLKANSEGVVQKVLYRAGSYVPAGGILATINTVGSLYVEAHYKLSPPDYARIKKGSAITMVFPDNSRVEAQVYDISLLSNGDAVDTIVKGRLYGADSSDFRFSVGTPVQASLRLNDRAWYQNIYKLLQNLFKPSGS